MKPTDLALFKVLLDKAIPMVVDGVDGKDGSQGLTGATGERGDVGKQGVSGKDGKDAVDGLTGATGQDGLDGADGFDGRRGKQGKIGTVGSDGVNGQDGLQGQQGPKGDTGDKGKGVKNISVNSENMLVITYDDGDLDIAGKVSITKEGTTLNNTITGAPVGTFGIKGTKTSDAGELIILGPWGKEFNTGFISAGGTLNNWITLTTSFSSIPTLNTPLLGGFVYNYLYNNDTLTLFRYIAAGGSDRYFRTFNGTTLDGLVATKAQTITL